MADPSTTPTAGTERAKPSDLDLEKGAYEPNSDMEAATVLPESDSAAARGDSDGAGEKGGADSEQDKDPNIVTWDGPDDPMNPMNWTMRKKWTNIAVMAILTIITPLGSSMFAPGIPRILNEFHETSSITATFIMTIYILGFAFGPLVIAPLSEMYGRSPLYNVGNLLFTIFTVCTALSKNIGMLMAFRFLMGVAGSVPITIGSGSIADMMPVEMRGRAMAAWALGPLLGPCIGPVAGGYLIRAAGWRWVYWLIAILAGVITVFTFFTIKESYAPVILERKAKRLRKETGNPNLRSALAGSFASPAEKLKGAIVRPLKLLCLTPIVTLMSLYVAVTYGILYLLFSTFSIVFPTYYGFGEGESGLVFIPSAIGMALGINVFGSLSDRLVKNNLSDGQRHRPEIRLTPFFTLPAGLAIPSGLFIYGWTIQNHVHWIVPMVGVVVFAFGLMGVMMCIQNYLLDVYPRAAASVTAALAVLRSLAGALLPLCAIDMYTELKMGWGNSLLGFISLGLVPIPLLFYIFGARLVKKFQVDF
ncbi:general substrate transporter [Thermothelomyces thermophilus ATCC 42464]|uniref:General substrate transporter n=1 Tax=Thermothelomyces thermophilus (strain ATCC 42464 / BCRC 31852 / DSM 1799) TaxID=573729 RepID=G2QFE3_THET4|nr:general substrate transporter [Thermothelomyces thermophilus ATCC 42464]AEO59172.1 general substrate transporter [Thermothelomyces thermophilus ATCC 42464]